MQESIATVIMKENDQTLENDDFLALLADESCDISVTKKLCTYYRTVSRCRAETFFVENCKIPNGTAETVTSLKSQLQKKQVKPKKTVSFGSDGASIMTGQVNGVAARLYSEVNPILINLHCIAHKLALRYCTLSAGKVQYLKKYQETLTSLFYWFKHSAICTSGLTKIQEVLDFPQIKVKEVHSVQWFSFYNALESVYLSWQPLQCFWKSIAQKMQKRKEC